MMGNTNTNLRLYRKKIDTQGNYLPFPGYTIVAHAIHPLPQPLVDLIHYLSTSELQKYYSFLPATSYHVTINPIENVHDEHKSLLSEKQSLLKQQNTSIICTVTNLICSKVILIEVEFQHVHNPNFNNIIADVRSNNLREANILHDYIQSWHLTLAYQYKDINDPAIRVRLDAIFHKASESLSPSFNIPLGQIRICHYDDMTKFTPI